MPPSPRIDFFPCYLMKLNKKSRDKIFDLHLGLTFDWRETGLLRWRIFLWMLFFGVCAFAAGLFVHVEVPEIRSRGDQPGAVVVLPADNPRLHQYVLRNTPLPVRGPVWADPVTAGPTGEMGVTLPSPRSADTPLAPLPPRVRAHCGGSGLAYVAASGFSYTRHDESFLGDFRNMHSLFVFLFPGAGWTDCYSRLPVRFFQK